MSLDYNTFLKWAEEHFDNVEHNGSEIKVNSIFVEDTHFHLWCNPHKNAYHCWKTDKSGNLFDLVSQVTGCNYHEAIAILTDTNEIRTLEDKLDKFFAEKYVKQSPKPHLSLPPDTFLISKMENNVFKRRAEEYLAKRHIDVGNLMFCMTGKYHNRIIIPYYGPNDDLIYWNSRDIINKSYLGPDSDVGVGKSDVLYMQSWPKENVKVYLTEGEFDAMSLTKCGIVAGACGGKAVSGKQIELLRPYRVCICFDTDISGAAALNKIGDKLIESGICEVTYVRPPIDRLDPKRKMDWNIMFIELGERVVSLYISTNEKAFTYWTSNTLRFNNR